MAEEEKSWLRRRTEGFPEGLVITVLMLVLLVIVGVFVYRMSTRPPTPDLALERSSVDRARRTVPDDFNPKPRFERTRDELRFRGAGDRTREPDLEGLEPMTRLADIASGDPQAIDGRRVELTDVEVQPSSGHSFAVTDGDETVPVDAPIGAPEFRQGQRVSISGRVAANDGVVRIEATRVEPPG